MSTIRLALKIIRAALEIRQAAASRHTRVQAAASGLALLVASVVVAAIMALAPGMIPGIDAAVAVAATLALLISPLLARAMGTNLIPAVAHDPPDPSLSPSPSPSPGEDATASILDRVEALARAAGIEPALDEPRVVAVRAAGSVAWTALTRPLPISIARVLGDEGYSVEGVVYDLASGQDTGRRVRVAPSMRKRYDGQGGQDGQDGQAS